MCYVWDILVVSRGLNALLWKESKLNFRIWATVSVSKACVFPQLLAQNSSALLCEPIEMQRLTPQRVWWRTASDTRDSVWVVSPLFKGMIGTWARCDKFRSWTRQKDPSLLEHPEKLGCSIHCGYSLTILLNIQLGRMGMEETGELCLNPRGSDHCMVTK